MAYAFDQTMNALKPDDQSQGSSNIFQAPQGQQAPGQQQAQGQSSNMPVSASTAGDLSGGGATNTSAATAQPQASQNQAQTGARNSLLSQNAGRTSAPVDMTQVTSGLGAAKNKLQNEADTYVANAGNLYGGGKVDSGTQGQISDFISSGNLPRDANAGQDVATKFNLDGSPSAAPTPSWFQLFKGGPTKVDPLKLDVDTNPQAVNMLSTDAGIGQLFRQQNSPEYSAGQAALDTSLLTGNQGFNQKREDAVRGAADLQSTRDKITTDAQGQAQSARDQAMANWKADVTKQLQGGAQGIQDSATGLKSAFDKQVAASQSPDAMRAMQDEAFKGITADPSLKGYLKEGDAGKYFSPNAGYGKTNWQDFVGDPEAQRYNAVESALGAGGVNLPGAGRFAGKTPSAADALNFDKTAYQNEVLGNANKSYRDYQSKQAEQARIAANQAKMKDDAAAADAAFNARIKAENNDFASHYVPPNPLQPTPTNVRQPINIGQHDPQQLVNKATKWVKNEPSWAKENVNKARNIFR